ncbi:glycoside hydrolase superfamily [Dactylonectria macrodidyma]|uniref:beta-glucosidase n=1 Tax=Dactylonectria macrodidyma TaxID=307937 RepID=A0A9P9CXU2_9HYPO|nr:glycoside hydrolase superfamily [Dactylonectria macrodidyma]
MSKKMEFHNAVSRIQEGGDVNILAQDLISQLTDGEKLAMLHGDASFWKGMSELFTNVYTKKPYPHGAIERLGIPGIQYCDGPRGVNINKATVFPCSTARGATWDPQLEERIGHAIGLEARTYGANCVGSVCINLPRHPAWGRVQETYGEDPLLLGRFGVAHVQGLETNVMSCVKHYALNSIETSRFRVNVSIDDAALHEVYLPHFKDCVDGGASSIMTAYNSVNGEWAGESEALIREILREKWKFGGITITDWLFGLRDGVKSVKADLDIEAPFQNRRAASLKPALESGELKWSDIDRLTTRILRTQLKFYATRQPTEPAADVVFSREHRDLARENQEVECGHPLLPLSTDLSSCAIIGRHADTGLTGDRASSWGIKEQLPQTTFHLSASDDEKSAIEAAKKSTVAIVIVGYDGNDEGEFLKPSPAHDAGALALLQKPDDSPEAQIVQAGRDRARDPDVLKSAKTEATIRPEDDFASRPTGGDRMSVRLRPQDVRLIRAVSAANPRTIVSIITAGAVIAEEWYQSVPSLLVCWYNGCENGRALADVLTGKSNPSGRLPWSMPRTEAHLPAFESDVNEITYDKWFGQRMLDRMGVQATYPLGYGISYTQFELLSAELHETRSGGESRIIIRAAAKNTGDRSGWCVLQVYGCPEFGPGPHDFPNRLLAGFKTQHIGAGETREVEIPVSLSPFRRWVDGDFVADARSITFQVGQYAGDDKSLVCRYANLRANL